MGSINGEGFHQHLLGFWFFIVKLAMPHCRYRVTIPLVMLVIMGGIVCTPGIAVAACGDYLITRSRSSQVVPDDSVLLPANHATNSTPGRRPCQGPNCHQANTPPSPTPVTIRDRTVHKPLLSVSAASSDRIAPPGATGQEPHIYVSQSAPDGIFHPPRPLST